VVGGGRFSAGVCVGEPFLAWLLWWRVVYRLAFVVASHAVLSFHG
jgi:hypothetical protein